LPANEASSTGETGGSAGLATYAKVLLFDEGAGGLIESEVDQIIAIREG
jgi:hypothetical protein